MSTRYQQLEARAAALRAQSAIQREHLGHTVRDIESRLAGIDRGVDIARRVIRQPAILAGGIALVALVGPKKILKVVGRGAVLFASGRRVLRLLRGD